MKFNDLPLIQPLLKAIEAEGYATPSPIQEKAIPLLLEHRDLIGCAQTGTGKTAAFALPILQRIHEAQDKSKRLHFPKALILTPTRELASQIFESFIAYGKFLNMNYAVIFGGVGQQKQVDRLKQGADIIIATPGRLLDLMGQGYIDTTKLEVLVLDEADRMLDMGFLNDVKKVLARLPIQKQTMLFSATMPKEIKQLADSLLKNPAYVEVTPASSTVDAITQKLYYVDKANKRHLLQFVIDEHNMQQVLVFTRTKHMANRVVTDLCESGYSAQAIHSNKSQNARIQALAKFKNGGLQILVATDIAARGIDIEELPFVVNYDMPNIAETYVHRIGRTGRAGKNGIAISFCDQEEHDFLTDIEKLIGFSIPVLQNVLYPARVKALDKFEQKALKRDKQQARTPKKTKPLTNKAESTKPKTNDKTKQTTAAGKQPQAKSYQTGKKQSASKPSFPKGQSRGQYRSVQRGK